jgi:hypothetical protein
MASKSKTWQYAFNQAISDTAANCQKKIVWLWSRCLLGDTTAIAWKAEDTTSTTPTGVWKMFWSCNGGGTTAGTNFGASTTIAAGSNGQALPQSTINVASTSNFPASGTFIVVINNVPQVITYTGTSGGNQFTGCTGGTGTLATSQQVVDNRDFFGGGSTFDATKIVNAPAASNHSWCVVYSTTNFGTTGQGPFYVTIDCASATSANTNIQNVLLGKIAPTGGTGTATPTSTDQAGLASTNYQFIKSSSATAYHLSGILSTDGICRVVWSQDGDGYFQGVFRADAFANALSNDTWPAAILVYAVSSTPGQNTWPLGKNAHGAQSANGTAAQTNSNWRGRSVDGASIVGFAMRHPAWFDTTNSATASITTALGEKTGTNQATGKWDQVPEIGPYCVTPGFFGCRGLFPDSFWWVGARSDGASKNIQDAAFDNTGSPANNLHLVGDLGEPANTAHQL